MVIYRLPVAMMILATRIETVPGLYFTNPRKFWLQTPIVKDMVRLILAFVAHGTQRDSIQAQEISLGFPFTFLLFPKPITGS